MTISKSEHFKPSEFMRKRRPEYFSDSKIVQESTLTKDYLEYHLDKISAKKQEYLFEEFARALAEKEICPNLVPQTGPLGGGDSKRDSENFKISEEIGDHFFAPIPKGAKEDHWAFAISASKNWKQKFKKDVKKIVEDTERGFDFIYYISSKLISDKKKANAQKEVNEEYDVQTQILDANWIIDRVFKNKRQELVYKYLDVDLPEKERKALGPKDSQREDELQQLKKKISDHDNYNGRKYVLVEDFLRAARISRTLEKPKSETLGLFDQAITIAKRVGFKNQIIRSSYQKAWTCYWWFNDPVTTWEVYQELEKIVYDSEEVSDIEMLSNLFVILYTAHRHELIDLESSEIETKKENLFRNLRIIADNDERPNNSINAKAQIQVLKLSLGIENKIEVKDALKELNIILKTYDNYLLFAVDPLIKLVNEIGYTLEEYEEYNELFSTICDLSEEREGEIRKGELLLNRGLQNIQIEEPLKAIRLIEEARKHLSKEESFRNFIICSVAISIAYKKLELYWAARKELIAALNHFNTEIKREGGEYYPQLLCAQQLIWCEILLGRVPQVLIWIEYSNIVAQAIDSELLDEKDYPNIYHEQDFLLALLILKSSIRQLKSLPKLVSVLDGLNLNACSCSLLFSLGDYQELINAYDESNKEAEKDILETFTHSLIKPENKYLPEIPTYHLLRKISYKTKILGTVISIELKNEHNSVVFAEDILGSIEAFFSTVRFQDMILLYPEIKINISQSELTSFPGKILDTSSKRQIEIMINDSLNEFIKPDQQVDYRNFLLEIVTKIFATSVASEKKEIEGKIEELAKEGAFSRSLNISPTYLFLANILGQEIMYKISNWTGKIEESKYQLKREVTWVNEIDEDLRNKINEKSESENDLESKKIQQVKHKDITRFDDYIVDEYWDQAKWKGMFYIVPNEYTQHELPVLGFLFEDSKGATELFTDLIGKVTHHDSSDIIKISIIEDLNTDHDYIVIFTCDPEFLIDNQKQESGERYFVFKKRMKLNHVSNYDAFISFKKSVQEATAYEIMPVLIHEGKPVLGEELKIKKHKITFTHPKNVKANSLEANTLEMYKDGLFD